MKAPKMRWNLASQLFILIILTLNNSSEARNLKHLQPSAVIVGTVFCDTCFQDDFSRSSHFISGAMVSVECKDRAFKKEVRTDEQGKFKVHLPIGISKHEKEIKGCQVRLLKSSEPYCAIASTATSSSIHLKSLKQGTRVFSAGFFTFKPLKQPDVCNQQPSINPSTKLDTENSLLDPLPQLPPLPLVPGLPTVPKDPPKGLESSKESLARPQFLFPSVIPPVFPSPQPAIGGIPLPPNPLQPPALLPFPPSQPSFGLPTIPGLPGLIPSPPPPPPLFPGLPIPPGLPSLPIPPGLPGLPIPPVIPPGLPGLPIPPVIPQGLPIPPVIPPADKVSP